MEAGRLLDILKSRGLSLHLRGDKLEVRGPKKEKTAALMEMLRQHKQELIAKLSPRDKPLVLQWWRRVDDKGVTRIITDEDWQNIMQWVWPGDDLREDRWPLHAVWMNAKRFALPVGQLPLEWNE